MTKKLTTEFVKSQFAMHGYAMIGEYFNNKTKIHFICPQGHSHSMKWNSFSQGVRCGKCAKTHKLSHDLVEKAFEARGYQMLSQYVNSWTRIEFVCPNGHRHSMPWSDFYSGVDCGLCHGKHRTTEYAKEYIELQGYQLLSEYKGSKEVLTILCPKGHQYLAKWNEFNAGCRCSVCFTQSAYKHPTSTSKNRVIDSVRRELKKQHSDLHWSYVYTREQMRVISKSVEHIYRTCPDGFAVDHIVPISMFNLLRESELLACWDAGNLRHLEAIPNLRRGNRMTTEEVDFMWNNQPEIIGAASSLWKAYRRDL